MAERIDVIGSQGTVTTTTPLVVSLGSKVQQNDLIVIVLGIRSVALTLPAGYTQLFNTVNGSARLTVIYKIAGASESAPSFLTTSSTANVGAEVVIYRGVKVAEPITLTSGIGYTVSSNSGLKEVVAPQLTVPYARSLILHVGHIDSVSIRPNPTTKKVTLLDQVSQTSATCIASEWVEDAGAQSSPLVWENTQTTARSSILAVICINDAVTPTRDVYVENNRIPIFNYVTFGNAPTLYAPNTVVTGDIGGVPVDTVVSPTQAYGLASAHGGGFANNNVTSYAVNTWVGIAWDVALDLSDKTCCLHWGTGSNWDGSRVGPGGSALAFRDTLGNYSVYQLRPYSRTTTVAEYWEFFTPANMTLLASSATPANLSLIDRIAHMYERKASATSIPYNVIGMFTAYSSSTQSVLAGGVSHNPITPKRLAEFLGQRAATTDKDLYTLSASLQGASQILLTCPIQLGNGIIPTHVDLSGGSFETPARADIRLLDYDVADRRLVLCINASASDVMNLSSCVIKSGTRQIFRLHPNYSAAAQTLTSGLSLTNWDIEWHSAVAALGVSVTDGGTAAMKAALVSGCTFKNGAESARALVESGAVWSNTTLTAGGSAIYGLRIATAGALSLSNVTFSGYTKDLDITATTGTVTVTLAAGQAVPTHQTAGAAVVFDAPVNTLTVAANVSLLGAEVRVYDLDNSPAGSLGTELGGIESCAGATFALPVAGANQVWVQIMKPGYEEFGQAYTMPAVSSTLTATLQPDTNA